MPAKKKTRQSAVQKGQALVTGPHTNKIWADALLRAVMRMTDQKTSRSPVHRLEKLADKVIALGLKGDMAAVREIGDRLDGKASQVVEHSGSVTLEGLIKQSYEAKSAK